MRNLLAFAVALLTLGLLLPAQADDIWETHDAISRTVKNQLAAERGETPDAPQDEEADYEDEEAEASRVLQRASGDETAPPSAAPLRDSGRSSAGAASASAQRGSGNVLGPLWGVPADAPVMQMIDPAIEMEYARDSQGRLVPRTQLTAEEEKALREREKQREREQREAEKQAAAEQKRRQKEAEAARRQQEREARLAREQEERAAREAERQSATRETVQDKDSDSQEQVSQDSPEDSRSGEDEEFRNHKMGGRSTPQDQGW